MGSHEAAGNKRWQGHCELRALRGLVRASKSPVIVVLGSAAERKKQASNY